MRLLHTTTFELREFSDTDIPPYGILSHTWGRNEFTFKDLQTDGYRGGITKIDGLCRVARGEELSWVWIDTCCIDKTSSAELSEAINSMFQWYKRAVVCYVYLEDYALPSEDQWGERDISGVTRSRWFTRGWTLQELLAAPKVFFYDQSWGLVDRILKVNGKESDYWKLPERLHPFSPPSPTWRFHDAKSSEDFVKLLQDITKISAIALSSEFEAVHQNFSVAEKMSWAAKRETTRIEDRAYSLMGLFDVNMPLLYGEGEKAFFRLQEEIIKKTDDESIFSWGYAERFKPAGGLFAKSPDDFTACRNITIGEIGNSPHYYLTNKGLHIQARISRTDPSLGPYFYAMIHCTDRLAPAKHCIAIPLCYCGNIIFRPPDAAPMLINDAKNKNAFSKDTVSLDINLTRYPYNYKTFPMPGYMLTQLEPCSTIQIKFDEYKYRISLEEVYPPNWHALNNTSQPLTVIQNLMSPTTPATIWMNFFLEDRHNEYSEGHGTNLNVALRLDLVWMLGPQKGSNRFGLALKSVTPLVKQLREERRLFVDVLKHGLSGWRESVSWGKHRLSVSWTKGEFDDNIRLNLERLIARTGGPGAS